MLPQEDLIEAVRTAVEENLMASCGNNSKRTYAQVKGMRCMGRECALAVKHVHGVNARLPQHACADEH